MINVSHKIWGGGSLVASRTKYGKRSRRTSNLALERLESRTVLTSIDGTTIVGLVPSIGGVGNNTLNYSAGGLTPTISAGGLFGEVLLSIPGHGTVDATNYETINVTDVGPLTITPGLTRTINSIPNVPNVDAIVGTFSMPIPIVTTPPPPGGLPPSDFQSTITWGDATATTAATIIQDASNPSVYDIEGTHTYVAPGTFTITQTIAFSGATYTTSINGIPVNEVISATSPATTPGTPATADVTSAPLATLAVSAFPLTAVEGGTIAASTPIASIIDNTTPADPVSDFTATINIINSGGTTVFTGAGTVAQNGTTSTYSVTTPAISLAALDEGTYQIQVVVTKTVGAVAVTATGSAQLVLADAALTAGAAVALSPHAGVALPASTVVGTFTDANATAPVTDFTATIDWGDGTASTLGTITQPGGVGTAFSVSGPHVYAKPGSFVTTVVVKDEGGSVVSIAGTATVTDAPVTGSTASFTATEGKNTGQFVLATFTDPNTLATVADVNATLAVGGWGDGTPTAAGVTLVVQEIGVTPLTSATNPGAPIFQVLGSHTYAEETHAGLPDTLSVIVTTLGGATTTLTSPPGGGVTVLDAALTSSNGTKITGIEGKSTGTILLGTFTDANQGATVADFTSGSGSVVVKWGDGTAAETLTAADLAAVGSPNGVIFTIDASHTYAEEGTYAYTVTVTDTGGATTVISGSAKIADAALTATTVQPTVDTTEAALFPVPVFAPPVFSGPVAEFSDGNPLPPTGSSSVADFTATIDWGDGTAPTAGTIVALLGTTTPTYAVTGSHTYADAGVNGGTGTYPIQVFVQDVGGSRLTLTNTAHVADIPITVTGQLNPASDSGLSTGTPDVTDVTQPNFFGTSEPFSHVTLSETALGGGLSVPIGTVQAGSDGSWSITSGIALANGSDRITATAVDQFGETTTAAPVVITSDLEIDTSGPIITGAFFNRLNGEVDYTIQDPSPASGPPSGVWVNTLLDSSNYLLTKVHANKAFPGKWIVTNVTETPGALPNSYDVAVVFNSGKQIRGGFYLFTIRDSSNGNSSVQDNAENHLDGVFYGSFPSGNGINGSDFTAMLSGFHSKIFAPQTIVGTANAANGGVGGPPIGAVHSGNFSPVVPVGGGSVFGTDPTHLRGTRTATTKKAVTRTKLAKPTAIAKSHSVKTAVHDAALKSLADQTKPGRLHK